MIPEKDRERINAFKDFCMMKITIGHYYNKGRDILGNEITGNFYGQTIVETKKPAIISLDFKALQFENGEIEYLPDGNIEEIKII